ncbi:MAG TPA: hypothetical protein VFZ00_12425 [Solirubrobacter sp.]|nr:hypothetical protein [Solirubrobacter sp.]
MSSTDRRWRRREEQVRPEPPRTAPAPPLALAPHVSTALALQRSAGNRALQRLLYNRDSRVITAPSELGDKEFPWNSETKTWDKPAAEPTPAKRTGRGGPKGATATRPARPTRAKRGAEAKAEPTEDAKPEPPKRTYANLINSDDTFREHIRKGMALDALNGMESLSIADLQVAVDRDVVAEDAEKGTSAEAMKVAQHQRQLLHYDPAEKFTKKEQVKPAWMVTDPHALVPGAPDLGLATDNLLTTDVPGKKGTKQWAYACVLIALAKLDEGYKKVKSLTHANVTTLEAAVQALHKYYVENDVQYDDSSTRFEIMKDWGYAPIWVGKAKFYDFTKSPDFPGLKKDQTYIFDITGHTCHIKPTKEIKQGMAITRPKDFFETWSDPRNYAEEMTFGQEVLNIWQKG